MITHLFHCFECC